MQKVAKESNDTFSVKTSDETCKDSDNGMIELSIKGTFSDPFGIQISGGPSHVKVTFPSVLSTVEPDVGVFKSAGNGA